MPTASAAALRYAWNGRPLFALGMACIAALAFSLRRWLIIPRMDALRGAALVTDTAILQFRRLHIAGMVLNVVQLAAVAWACLPFGLPGPGAVCGVARAGKASALLRPGALHPAPGPGNAISGNSVNRP
jgi:hypothetical protein